jgi:hypothetical protein
LVFRLGFCKLGNMRALCLGIIFLLLFGSCVSTKNYAQAEKDLCDCLSGMKAPADEFCTKWNTKVSTEKEQLDRRMAGLSTRKPEKYEVLLLEISLIEEERDTCRAKLARFH